ncbi:hypothetical protein [Arthrobacter sp. EPSL27]|uniref:hypothetical protein n=1 Tax=Arthrobacter sp. EPSL27 TaxID=1745378 RepID=UPI000ABA57A8|nr:hypothetical protein [Arthrobacter sp. EPSL27]
MDISQLPTLPPGVEYLGKHAEAEEEVTLEGGLTLPILRARYRVHGLTVVIGWIVGHPMGDFREPNSLHIEFDAFDYGMGYDASSERAERPAFEGITTSVLRSIPMAHAKALMQERYEQMSIADIQGALSPMPSRVETDNDYVHIAAAYEALAGVSIEPVKRLGEWTGESVETWSARLRRARAKGILEGKGRASRIAPAYRGAANALWTEMRARKDSL